MDNEVKNITYTIPEPPREIYQFDTKVNTIMREGTPTYMLDKIEYNNGIFVYLKGASFPQKGFPTPAAMWEVNLIKRFLIETLKIIVKPIFIPTTLFFIVLPYKRKIKLIESILESYNRLSMGSIKPFLLKHNFMTPCASELYVLIKIFLVKLGIKENTAMEFAEIFSHIIQYDNAYRFRLQDILSETNIKPICSNPRKEIKRLLKILKERDNQVVGKKFQMFSYLFMLILSVKRIKKIFIQVISDSKFEKLQYDAADRYWVCLRDDYKYMGLDYQGRLDLLEIDKLKRPQAYIINI